MGLNSAILSKYEQMRVPRYTSYPTAPHFTPAVGPDQYLAWLRDLPAGTATSLYLHVPFCKQMCWYCGCFTKVVARYDPIADYVRQMASEIDLVADAAPSDLRVHHVHWGGGTPTALEPSDFRALMTRLRERFHFAPDAEAAVEIDPRTLTEEMVAALAESGINRASLGVQDFDAEVQRQINRTQSFARTAETVGWLRAAGIEALSLDLMYGLPGQTVETCVETAAQAISLRPNRLSVFGYAHVPWMKSHQRLIDENHLPDGPARWAQMEAISDYLVTHGYRAIGLDHFAADDDEMARLDQARDLRRNFQGYTTDQADTLIGFGASAIGSLPQGYVQNAPALAHYAEAIRFSRPATARGLALSAEDRLRRDVIERIMCNLTVDLAAVARAHGSRVEAFEDALARVRDLAADGLATVEGWTITVPEAGRPMVRLVAAAFDTYLNREAVRHARAI